MSSQTISAEPSLLHSLADLLDPPSQSDFPSPADLAKAIDPMTRQTPALDIIDRALIDVDAGQCDRLVLSMPPQEGKSERVSRFGVLWMLRRNPQRRIGLVSYGEDIAQRMTYIVRNDISTFNGDEGTLDVGLRLRKDNKAASRWNLDGARGGLYGIGVGGGLTGRPLDALLIDDPVKDYQAADSLILSERAWQWWMSVARPRLAPGAPVVVIMTRWHELDLAGRMLAKQKEDEQSELEHYDRWRVINIPAQADHRPELGETDLLGREPGEFMVSARGRTQEQWEATKAATIPRIWSALYQGKPTPDTGDIFQRPWWRRFETPIWSQQDDGSFVVHEQNEVIQSWDMTFKDKASSDFVVGQVWVRQGARAFLVDQVHARLSFTATVSAFRRLVDKWPQSRTKLVEDKANGTAVINVLAKEVGGIVAVSPKESKISRAAAISPFVEAGNVWLPTTDIALFDVEGFIEEMTAFPNSAHDDQVDGTSQALTRFFLRGAQGAAFMEAWKHIGEKDNAPASAPEGRRETLREKWRRVERELAAQQKAEAAEAPTDDPTWSTLGTSRPL